MRRLVRSTLPPTASGPAPLPDDVPSIKPRVRPADTNEPERLLWGKRETRMALSISDRTLDRLIASKRFPPPGCAD